MRAAVAGRRTIESMTSTDTPSTDTPATPAPTPTPLRLRPGSTPPRRGEVPGPFVPCIRRSTGVSPSPRRRRARAHVPARNLLMAPSSTTSAAFPNSSSTSSTSAAPHAGSHGGRRGARPHRRIAYTASGGVIDRAAMTGAVLPASPSGSAPTSTPLNSAIELQLTPWRWPWKEFSASDGSVRLVEAAGRRPSACDAADGGTRRGPPIRTARARRTSRPRGGDDTLVAGIPRRSQPCSATSAATGFAVEEEHPATAPATTSASEAATAGLTSPRPRTRPARTDPGSPPAPRQPPAYGSGLSAHRSAMPWFRRRSPRRRPARRGRTARSTVAGVEPAQPGSPADAFERWDGTGGPCGRAG